MIADGRKKLKNTGEENNIFDFNPSFVSPSEDGNVTNRSRFQSLKLRFDPIDKAYGQREDAFITILPPMQRRRFRIVKRFLFTLLATSLPIAAHAQAGPRDVTFEDIVQHRNNYTNVVLFFGDSIARGFALRFFPDEATDEQKQTKLWPLRSPASMINFLSDSGDVKLAAAYGGGPIAPEKIQSEAIAKRLAELDKESVIRAGDVVVLEDAGDRKISTLEYRDRWREVIDAASKTKATIIVINTFDAGPDIAFSNVDWRDFSFHTSFDVPAGSPTTYNEAIAQAAIGFPNNVITVDLDTSLRALEGRMLHNFDLPLLHEGVHPNVWGECGLVSVVVGAANLKGRVDFQRLAPLLAHDLDRVSYGASLQPGDLPAAVEMCSTAPLAVLRPQEH